MNTGKYDTVIIGGGMSGLMAAITLTKKGRKVALISKGDPVCCLSSGCIDILGHVESPIEGMASLPDNHPYHLVGEQNIKKAMTLFLSVMEECGLPYTGTPDKNRKIMTPVGTSKSTALVPESMAEAPLLENDYLHVISFKYIKDFFPAYITNRHKNSGLSVFDAGVPTTLGIAAAFDNKPFLYKFIQWVKSIEMPSGKIAVPAVLGTKPHIFSEIVRETGRAIFEIPTLPPSIPGLRLFKALKRHLQDAGVDLYWGQEVTSVELDETTIEAVTLKSNERPTRIEGKSFILATGSFISGGLYASQKGLVKESVFDLPAFIPQNRDTWFNPSFFEKGHEIEKAGIQINSSFQPKEAEYANLFVCGSILAYSEIMKYQCGHGLAMATGYTAAMKCEDQLS